MINKEGNVVEKASVEIETVIKVESKKERKEKEMNIFASLIKHLKPIIINIFTILFLIVRPLLLLILSVRKIVVDWEKPFDAVCFNIAFYYIWWHSLFVHLIICGLFWGMLKRLIQRKVLHVHFEGRPEKKPTEMLQEFKKAVKTLKYGQ